MSSRPIDPQLYAITQQLEYLGKYVEALVLKMATVDQNTWQLLMGKVPNPKLFNGYYKMKNITKKWIRQMDMIAFDPYYVIYPEEKEQHIFQFQKVIMLCTDKLQIIAEEFHPFKSGVQVLLNPYQAGEKKEEVTIQDKSTFEGIKKKFANLRDSVSNFVSKETTPKSIEAKAGAS